MWKHQVGDGAGGTAGMGDTMMEDSRPRLAPDTRASDF